MSYANSRPGGSSRSPSWQEMRYKRNEDRRHEWDGEHFGLGEGSTQMYRSTSKIPEQEHCDGRDLELERLHRLVKDLELEVQGRRQRRNHNESPEGSVHTGDNHKEASYQSDSRRSRERS